MLDPFVIKVLFGGLGDHLFYSHLPRIAKEVHGIRRVLVSNLSVYRNPEYRKLVWELNPFVDGFCDDDAHAPPHMQVRDGANLLDELMWCRGLDDGKRMHEPEVFYRPKSLPELSRASVFDPNYVSFVGAMTSRDVDRFFSSRRVPLDCMLRPRSGAIIMPGELKILETPSVFDYCDVIASSRQFYCLTSGGATLAAALGKPVVALYGEGQNPMFHHSVRHEYVCVGKEKMATKAGRYLRRGASRLLKGLRRAPAHA